MAAESDSGGFLVFFGRVAFLGIGLAVVISFAVDVAKSVYAPSSRTATLAAALAEREPETPRPRKPAPPPRVIYRGVLVERMTTAASTRYRAAELGIADTSLRGVYLQINARLFRRRTGITDEGLEGLYAGADTNRNGHLAWEEIVQFQGLAVRSFAYRRNSQALSPSQFLAEGGGDCEDWALFTCGLLRYWGWNCRVGSFGDPRGPFGHAVCLVWSARPIPGYGSLHVPRETLLGAELLPSGHYIPIDYDHVGSLSSAVGDDWVLTAVYEPEELYGRSM